MFCPKVPPRIVHLGECHPERGPPRPESTCHGVAKGEAGMIWGTGLERAAAHPPRSFDFARLRASRCTLRADQPACSAQDDIADAPVPHPGTDTETETGTGYSPC